MTPTRVLVLGAYGLIGQSVVHRLRVDGFDVTGLGRTEKTARRTLPDLDWILADLTDLVTATSWQGPLANIQIVVNCAGALQDGPDNDLETLQHTSVSALAQACAARDIHLIQVSAAGASTLATTQFFASKARGDDAIKRSGTKFQILRPGLVIAPSGYGGTTLLRQLAAVPFVSPVAQPETRIKTVSVDDVAHAVSLAASGHLPQGLETDIVERDSHSLAEIIGAFRHWLGYPPAIVHMTAPVWIARLVGKLADGLAYLGWKSPLRTTAQKVLDDGIDGLTHPALGVISSLDQTLAKMPARTEDRLFARISLLTPISIVVLAVFWLASGVIGAAQADVASQGLIATGWPTWLALPSVYFWSVVDIGIAGGLLFRNTAQRACIVAIVVSLFYLGAATLFLPALWADPLGPLVKVPPSILLALFTYIGLEKR